MSPSLDVIRRAPLSLRGLDAVVDATAAIDDLGALVTQLLDEHDTRAATLVACAAHEQGRKLPPEPLARTLVDLETIAVYASLLGALEGDARDKVEFLLLLVEGGQQSEHRDALALLLISKLVGEVPEEIRGGFLRRHRYLLRRLNAAAGEFPSGFLVLAAAMIDEALFEELADIEVPRAALDDLAKQALSGFLKRPSELLDEEPPPVIAAYTGVPARRATSKVGRNDPCPCNSGKKYKICCIAKAVTADVELKLRVDARTPVDALQEMRSVELAKIELSGLTWTQLITIYRRLVIFHRWELAKRVLMEMDRQRPDATDHWRDEMIEEARDLLDWKTVRSEIALMKKRDPSNELLDALLSDEGRALKWLEKAADNSERGNSIAAFDAAFALLKTHPALGLVMARGSLSPDHMFDSYALLDAINEARRQLDMPPDTTTRERFDRLCDVKLDEKLARAKVSSAEAREHVLAEKINELRAEAQDARDKLTALERRERLSRRADHGRANSTNDKRTSQAPRSLDKLERIKSVVAEGQAERMQLRRELADALAEIEKLRGPTTHGANTDEPSDGEEPVDAPGRLFVRAPHWSPRASESLHALETRIARQALLVTAELAAGDAAAWKQVKRLAKNRQVLSARVDLGHRILFTVDGATLEVSDVIARRDLERWLKT